MKNIYKIFTAAIAVLTFASCENEENLLFLKAPAAEFTILTPDTGTSIILDKITANNAATTLAWQAVDFGTPTVVTYVVQIAKANTDFLVPIDVAFTTKTTASISVSELNKQAIALGLAVDKSTAIEARVKATVGTTGSETKFSNIINLFVTPYTAVEPTIDLYMIGDAVPYGWSANGNLPMARDLTNPKKFYYSGYFKVGEFKLDTVLGGWSKMYGFDGTAVVAGGGSIGNFKITTAGYYSFELNIGDLSYSLTPISGTPKSYTVMNTKGTSFANAWNADNVMTQTDESHVWKLTIAVLEGEFQFHADNWATQWGPDGVNTGNIKTTFTGTYTVYFNDINGKYIFIK